MVAMHQTNVQKCLQYSWVHMQAERFYVRCYWALAIPTTLLNVVVGSVGLTSLTDMAKDPFWYVLLALFFLNIGLGFLNGMNSILQPNTTAKNHRDSAMEFTKLAEWLQIQLQLEPHARDQCDTVTREVLLQLENLRSNSDHIPWWIADKLLHILDDRSPLPPWAIRNVTPRTMDESPSDSVSHIALDVQPQK